MNFKLTLMSIGFISIYGMFGFICYQYYNPPKNITFNDADDGEIDYDIDLDQ